MKDKLILSFYIDIRDVDNEEVQQYLNHVKDAMYGQMKGESDVMAFFIPIRGESRIECVNPVLIMEEEAIDRFNKAMDTLQELSYKSENKEVNKKEDEKTEE
jgi:hypothetical protein